jgi:hypothetical protein
LFYEVIIDSSFVYQYIPTGMAITSSMEGGRLASDSLANKVAIQNLKNLQEKKMKAVILDGMLYISIFI